MEFFFTLHCCWRRQTLYTEGVAGNKNDAIMTCYFKRCELTPLAGHTATTVLKVEEVRHGDVTVGALSDCRFYYIWQFVLIEEE